jgi:hypothetical protein
MSDRKIKNCKKCGTERYVGDKCKVCNAAKSARHFKANREKINARTNQWKHDHPEKVKEWSEKWKMYREEHRDEIREKDRLWRAANIEKNRARQREHNRLKSWQDKAASNCNKRALDKGVLRGMKGINLLDPITGKLPEYCPIFPHIKLDYSQGPDRRHWASVDRKVPSLGYTSGNVWVVSMAANTWKTNGSNPAERAIITKMMAPKITAPKPPDGQILLF